MPRNQSEINARQRERRKLKGNITTHIYEKTPNGFLMRLYRNMKSRINGTQKLKYHLYAGKELLDKEVFYRWAMDSKEFHHLFGVWTKAGHDQRLAPSVDRIDSSKGYILSNMRWVTNSINSSLGAASPRRKSAVRETIYKIAGVK